jgi:3-methylcrotonyl-CoA carboxylase alpha subunit
MTLTTDVARAVGGDGKVVLVLDAITVEGTLTRIAEVMSAQGTLTLLLPIKAEGPVIRSQPL